MFSMMTRGRSMFEGGAKPLKFRASLLTKADTGVQFDFSLPVSGQQVAIKQGATLTTYDPDAILVNGSNTPNIIISSEGIEEYAPHNLFLNSAAPATQSYSSAIVGETYTVSLLGTGSLEIRSSLGDGNTLYGTATQSAPLTFVATQTVIRIAGITGAVQRIQLNRGPTTLKYLVTTSAVRFGVPISKSPITGEMMLMVEPNRTNYLLNSGAPVTQTVSLNAGTYTLWIVGTGSVALSGGPTGTATAGQPATFVLASATLVTFTVADAVVFFQCENGAVPTSRINTWGKALGRSLTNITVALSALPTLGDEFLAYCDYVLSSLAVTNYIYAAATDGNNRHTLYQTGSSTIFLSVASGVSTSQTLGIAAVARARTQFTGAFRSSTLSLTMDGKPTTKSDNIIAAMPALTTLTLGSYGGQCSAPVYIKRFALVPTQALQPAFVAPYFYQYQYDPTAYDIILIAGQSNCFAGSTINPLIDVSGDRAYQLSLTTTASYGSVTGNVFGDIYDGSEPMRHPLVQTFNLFDAIGFGVAFARDYYIPNVQTPTGKTLLINAGVGNTGFYSATAIENRWNPGDDLYNFACSAVGVMLARFPNSRLKAVLWMQGEWDAERGMSQSEYTSRLSALVAGLRAQFGATVPVIVGGMKPAWVAADSAVRSPVQLALADAPNQITFCGYADPTTSPAIGDTQGTNAHYTASEQRIFAGRFWDGFASATGIL